MPLLLYLIVDYIVIEPVPVSYKLSCGYLVNSVLVDENPKRNQYSIGIPMMY